MQAVFNLPVRTDELHHHSGGFRQTGDEVVRFVTGVSVLSTRPLHAQHAAQLPPLTLMVDLTDIRRIMDYSAASCFDSAMPLVGSLRRGVCDAFELTLDLILKDGLDAFV